MACRHVKFIEVGTELCNDVLARYGNSPLVMSASLKKLAPTFKSANRLLLIVSPLDDAGMGLRWQS